MMERMYVFIFIIVFIICKNVYALDDYFQIQSNVFITADENSNVVSSIVQSASHKKYKKKKVLYPILGDIAPIVLNLGLGLGCMALPYDIDKDIPANTLCFGVMLPASFLISSIGTIPSNLYSKTPIGKVIGYSIAKLFIGAFMGYAVIYGIGMADKDDRDDDKWDVNKSWLKGMLYVNGGIFFISAFEMLSQAKAIEEYNRNIDANSEIYVGVISNNAVGLKYQIIF